MGLLIDKRYSSETTTHSGINFNISSHLSSIESDDEEANRHLEESVTENRSICAQTNISLRFLVEDSTLPKLAKLN